MNKRGQAGIIIGIMVIVGVLVGGYFLFFNNEPIIADDSGMGNEGNIKAFSMTAKQWVFIPDTITVNEGDTVKLTIESVDVDHGVMISDFNVNEHLSPGETVNIEFVADKKGTFTFFCNVFCGSGHSGMEGKIIVE